MLMCDSFLIVKNMANSQLLLPSGFPRAPLGNGLGRYMCQLKRITLKFCKERGDSVGMRLVSSPLYLNRFKK